MYLLSAADEQLLEVEQGIQEILPYLMKFPIVHMTREINQIVNKLRALKNPCTVVVPNTETT